MGLSNNCLFNHPVRDIIIYMYMYMYRQDCITTEIKVVGGYFCDLLIHTDASLLNLAFVEKVVVLTTVILLKFINELLSYTPIQNMHF